MTIHREWFNDLLLPGEEIMAEIDGPGWSEELGHGRPGERWQLGFTQGRLLIVQLAASRIDGAYRPSQRFTVDKASVEMVRFPHTPRSSARLEIHGAPAAVVLYDIDHPDLFPRMAPFLAAWGGSVGGAGQVIMALGDGEVPGADHGKMLIALVIGVVCVGVCCGCSLLTSLLAALL